MHRTVLSGLCYYMSPEPSTWHTTCDPITWDSRGLRQAKVDAVWTGHDRSRLEGVLVGYFVHNVYIYSDPYLIIHLL